MRPAERKLKSRPLYSSGTRAASGAGQGAVSELRTYARYPRYPQPESALCDSDFVTASRRGRDDRSATIESLPGHGPSGFGACPTRLGGGEAEAGRLTKPPRCGREGLAQANADGRLREAPTMSPRPRPEGCRSGTKGTPVPDGPFDAARDFGPERASGRMEDFGSPFARRTLGFGPGCRWSNAGASARAMRKRKKRSPDRLFAKRRTARASALSGSPLGNRTKRELRMAPEGRWRKEPPVLEPAFFEAARRGRLAPPGLTIHRNGTVGAGSDVGPHCCLGSGRILPRPPVGRFALFPVSAA
jgi:hypothetical protein